MTAIVDTMAPMPSDKLPASRDRDEEFDEDLLDEDEGFEDGEEPLDEDEADEFDGEELEEAESEQETVLASAGRGSRKRSEAERKAERREEARRRGREERAKKKGAANAKQLAAKKKAKTPAGSKKNRSSQASAAANAAAAASKRRVRDPGQNPVWFKPVMFGFILIGLLWILVYYLSSARLPIPELNDWNILVGLGIAFVGLLMTTNWK